MGFKSLGRLRRSVSIPFSACAYGKPGKSIVSPEKRRGFIRDSAAHTGVVRALWHRLLLTTHDVVRRTSAQFIERRATVSTPLTPPSRNSMEDQTRPSTVASEFLELILRFLIERRYASVERCSHAQS
jgi:hypothetical protein